MTTPNGPRALVVEDNPLVRRLVQRALARFGCHTVLEAEDGVEAQALLREHADLDLVITDILMPRLDGLELLRWAREHAPQPVWIILSGLDSFTTAVEAIRLGAFDFLAKPPRIEELEVSVRNALERRALLRDRARLHDELEQANRELIAKVQELEDKSELLRRDLQRAETIQRALLPAEPPPLDEFAVQAVYRPGQHVGGDLYDVRCFGQRHVALYVADATGHGVTSAMLSVLFKQKLRMLDEESREPLPPAEVLGLVNRALCESATAPGLFLTAAYCLFDLEEGIVTLASAGHPPVLHISADGGVRPLERTGPALALRADAAYAEHRLSVTAEDRLLLYTDGLLISESAQESERRAELARLAAAANVTAAELLTAMVRGPAGEPAPEQGLQADDITLVLVRAGSGSSAFDNGALPRSQREATVSPGGSSILYGETDDATVLALQGRVNWTQCDALFQAGRAVAESRRPLVLDFADCSHLDSTCLGTVHELVVGGAVRLQNVDSAVRELFDELSMEQVLERIHDEPVALPPLQPLRDSSASSRGRRRILQAHEALSALSSRNREKFENVVAALRREL